MKELFLENPMIVRQTPIILIAEDDPDDFLLIQDAMEEIDMNSELHWVKDGQELLEYLKMTYSDTNDNTDSRPGLILLDLNMPRMDGFETLAKIKANPQLRRIPVIVLTTSSVEEDIQRTYDHSVAGFITKEASFDGLVETLKVIGNYWFETVQLPRS
jgi:two-component system response regulator